MRRFAVVVASFLAFAAWTIPVRGQSDAVERSQGITVSGSGEVRAKPNIIEVQMRSAAKAELTGDAIVKYRDAKRRTLAAFTGLKIENIEIEEEGLSITPGNAAEMMQMMWRGMGNNNTSKTQIELASTLTVRLKGIDSLSPEDMTETIGKILDVAQDSGATVGPSADEAAMAWNYGRMRRGGIVKFVLNDLDDVREKAYAKAAEDARARASRQARLFGVALGDVLAVQEVFVSGENQSQRVYQPWNYDDSDGGEHKTSRITSDSLTEIPFRVKLLVRYAIKPAEAKSGAD